MPHSNMNPGARRRHNIRIVTVGRYRMLKDNQTNKVISLFFIFGRYLSFFRGNTVYQRIDYKIVARIFTLLISGFENKV
jgi:hypothetical protein